MRTTLLNDAGERLDAEVSLRQVGTNFELTFESSGESGRRNGQYRQAFELALRRLSLLNAVLHDARVESRVTRDWEPEAKRLELRDAQYPLPLSALTDINGFARGLRSSAARIGNVSGRGGNTTKRVTLAFAVASNYELHELSNKLFGTCRLTASFLDNTASLHDWWSSRPGESFWMEVTGRNDLGSDLRAPLTNENDKPFWSYSLLRLVKAGDVILHYQREEGAIVALSRASGTQWTDNILWGARGSSARDAGIQPHTRAGVYVGLEAFRYLADSISLGDIRAQRDRLERAVESLKADAGPPLYFPFEFSRKRDLRPIQGYLFKIPALFIEMFEKLKEEIAAMHEPREHQLEPLGPAPYRRANEAGSVAQSDPFSVDPAIKERALRSHAATQNALADLLTSRGLCPFSSLGDQPNFDIAWEQGDTLWVAEVKSLTVENEEKQLRLGLGQILRYRQLCSQQRRTRAALIIERAPRDKTWITLCTSLGVVLAWPDEWDRQLKA